MSIASKHKIQRQIAAADKQIDKLIHQSYYDLHGLRIMVGRSPTYNSTA
jgi:hypothetical protein